MSNNAVLLADWPAPPTVHALTTTRRFGHSQAPYDNNNLGMHVGDKDADVMANRDALVTSLALINEPIWLHQTHTTHCVLVEEEQNRHADAVTTRQPNTPLVIMTADCLPILLCNRDGSEIAAIHAGWRGLVNGIVENTLLKMHSSPDTLLAWIGPSICHRCYEVGAEMETAFINQYPFTKSTFKKEANSTHADLPKMAELVLQAQGVDAVYQSNACTFEHKNDFYSYRREAQTGRIATLIWFTGQQ